MAAQCKADTLNIDTSKFGTPAHTYDIRSPKDTFTWTDSAVSSNDGLANCGTYTWEIKKQDGTSDLESTVYTLIDLVSATKTIEIETNDIAKAGNANY